MGIADVSDEGGEYRPSNQQERREFFATSLGGKRREQKKMFYSIAGSY